MLLSSKTAKLSIPEHVNNFDFLRLLFATFVLVTHSYPLAGEKEEDILFHLTGGQISLSTLGVFGFFVISGYLITKSMMRSETLIDYYIKRCIRVFPGLWVHLLITVFVCFFISGKSVFEYLLHYSTRDYLFFNSILKLQPTIDGVFTNNPFKNFINGSLWTIPIEFTCYIILSILFVYRKNIMAMRIALSSAFVVTLILQFFYQNQIQGVVAIPFFELSLGGIIRNLIFFIGGGLWALYSLLSIKSRKIIALISFLILASTLIFNGVFYYTVYLFLPSLLISFGTLNFKSLSWIRKYGDFSYGIYLWGFFIQQLLMYFFQLNYIQLMAISIPLAYLIGALSWFFVEKKALMLKLNYHQNPLLLKIK